MHVRFRNVLNDHGDIEVPCTDRLVVRRRNEASVLIDESDCVDRSKMLVIFLCDLARVYVILVNDKYTCDYSRVCAE